MKWAVEGHIYMYSYTEGGNGGCRELHMGLAPPPPPLPTYPHVELPTPPFLLLLYFHCIFLCS